MHSAHSSVMLTEYREINNQKLLVLGCGNKGQCRYFHPHAYTLTIDKDSRMQPNIVYDICQKDIPKEIQHYQFDAIILEYLPIDAHESAIRKFHSLLSACGYIVIAGASMCDVNFLQDYDGVYYESCNLLILTSHNIQQKMPWWHHKALSTYLRSVGITESDVPDYIHVSTDEKKYCHIPQRVIDQSRVNWQHSWERLLELYSDSTWAISFVKMVNTIKELRKLIENEKITPLTYQTLFQLLYTEDGYQPGYFRRYLTGDTAAIKALKKFYDDNNQFNSKPLDDNERNIVIDIINARFIRMRALPTMLDPTRSFVGETTWILKKLIMHLLITDQRLVDLLKSNHVENEPTQPLCLS